MPCTQHAPLCSVLCLSTSEYFLLRFPECPLSELASLVLCSCNDGNVKRKHLIVPGFASGRIHGTQSLDTKSPASLFSTIVQYPDGCTTSCKGRHFLRCFAWCAVVVHCTAICGSEILARDDWRCEASRSRKNLSIRSVTRKCEGGMQHFK